MVASDTPDEYRIRGATQDTTGGDAGLVLGPYLLRTLDIYKVPARKVTIKEYNV